MYAHDHYGREVDDPANLSIIVMDKNDEFPKFVMETLIGDVPEHSFAGEFLDFEWYPPVRALGV